MTKYYSSGGLNDNTCDLILLEAVKAKIQVPADSVSGEDLLPGLQAATFLLSPHSVKREFFPLVSLVRALIPS